ncbi:MAG: DoxX family protein [Myxococcota bacterium]
MTTQTLSAPLSHSRSLIDLGLAVGLALPMIVFGLNKLIGFADVPPPEGEAAQRFLGTMFTTYLAPLVALTEIVGGALYLWRRTAFIGLLILCPLMANIVAFHVAHAMPGNGIWLFSLLFFGVAMWKHREDFRGLVR